MKSASRKSDTALAENLREQNMPRNVQTVLIQKPVNFVELLLLVKTIELSIVLKLAQTKLKLKLKNKRNIHVVIYVKAADLNLQQDNEGTNIVMIVILNVELVQAVDDLRLQITNTVINVKIYLIVLLVRLVDEYFPVLNSQHTAANADQSVWFVDEKYLQFIMAVVLYLVR